MGELERLVDAGEIGDLNFELNSDRLSGRDAEIANLVNNALSSYMASAEYELMKYRLASDALGVVLWDMDVLDGDPVNPNNRFIWSQEFRRLLGFSNEIDFPNMLHSWSDRLHPEDKEKTLNAFAAHLNDYTGRTPYSIEYRLMKKSGEYILIKANGSTLRSADGAPIRVVGSVEDITNEIRQN